MTGSPAGAARPVAVSMGENPNRGRVGVAGYSPEPRCRRRTLRHGASATGRPASLHAKFASTWRMFRGASAVRKQLARSEGVVGFSMLARPLRKQYATLSVWFDEEALSRFSGEIPHHRLMSELSPEMAQPGDPGSKTRDGSIPPPWPMTDPRTDDVDWLPVVAGAGWTVITKDKKIRKRPAELEAVRDSRARMVLLAGKTAGSVWGQLTIVTRYWPQIEGLTAMSGPLIRRLTHRGMVVVDC